MYSFDELMPFIMLVIVIAIYLFIGLFFLINYVLTAIGLHTVAAKRKLPMAWLAWIPVGNSWVLGSIIDYHTRLRGFKQKWRIVLPVLSLMVLFVCAVMFLSMMGLIIPLLEITSTRYVNPEEVFLSIIGPYLIFYISYFLLIIVTSVLSTCQTVCIYKVFEETVPNKAVSFFVLSMLIPLASGVCLILCRKSKLGVPGQEEAVLCEDEQIPDGEE